MEGFLTIVVIAAGMVMLFRYLRRREVERFRDTDMKTLHELTGADPTDLPTSSDMPTQTASLPPKLRAVAEEAIASREPERHGAELRPSALDDIHANVLRLLEQMLGKRYYFFVNKPVADFLRVEKGPGELMGRSVSFLACDRNDFSVKFVLQLRGAGQVENAKHQFLQTLLEEAGVPLAVVPLMPNLSRAEIEAELKGLKRSPPGRPAPQPRARE